MGLIRKANEDPIGYTPAPMCARLHDLHSHSTASDGTLAPSELVAHASVAGVDVLALTDHDTTAGLKEAGRAAQEHGLLLVPGVEVSVTWQGRTIHVLGLRLDSGSAALEEGLARLRAFRDWRAEEIGRRLEKQGIAGAFAGARRLAPGPVVSRTHFARYLVQQGKAANVREVFRHFLVRNKPGYVPGRWASLEEAVGWIKNAGGQAVVAHPARYRLTAGKLRTLLHEFAECGGVGMEVVSGSHSAGDARAMAEHARRVGLLASSGSDFHGPEQAPWIRLGGVAELPQGCTPIWEAWNG